MTRQPERWALKRQAGGWPVLLPGLLRLVAVGWRRGLACRGHEQPRTPSGASWEVRHE